MKSTHYRCSPVRVESVTTDGTDVTVGRYQAAGIFVQSIGPIDVS